MPRGRPSSASKKGVANGPPPSHPAETSREHRKFLIRSLERNDIEMNALIELNKSLHKAKETILKDCGELVLLDLGSGRLKLINDELHEETKEGEVVKTKDGKRGLTVSQTELCVDFLLRMKLRRKLSTRLVRRLTRLAHVMDGKDAYPPSAPKYGDLRLTIDPKSLESWQADYKLKEEAKKRVQTTIDSGLLDKPSGEEKEGETEKEKDSPDETKSGDAPGGEPKDESSTPAAEEKPVDGDKDAGEKGEQDQVLLDDFKLIKELDSIYEKTWDAATKSFTYSIANEEIADPDFQQFTRSGGIGATQMFLSLEQLEAEHKRWQTHLLRKIQAQPTFEELGLKNRVFHLEERRKRCLEEMETKGGEAAAESPTKKAKIEGEDNTENAESEKETKKESGGDADDNSDSDDDEEIMEGENTNVEDLKPKRSISFAATPSFHDQDLARIRLVHRDLLNSSQAELTRKRLADATNEYNQAHQLSTKLFNARQMLQHNLTFAIAKGRQELTKAHSDYTIAYTAAKQNWLKEKFAYDMKKSQSVLPTKSGYQPLGTELIKNYRQRNCQDIRRATVGQTLADVVDGSILAAQGKAPAIPRFKDFVPPPAPGMNAQTGENMAQRQHRVETELRKQYTAVDEKVNKSEQDRGRAWRKVMKAQAEINAVSGNTGRGVRITMANYNQIPVPAIRGSAQQSMPTHQYTQPTRTSYPSTPSSISTSTTDMSKYSASKVKARKSADGTVAPVSEPKKTKDGLYLRPAGRTRKGMQWDAVNGVWVPHRQN